MNEYVVSYIVCGKIYKTILKGNDEEDVRSYCSAYLFGTVVKIELYRRTSHEHIR